MPDANVAVEFEGKSVKYATPLPVNKVADFDTRTGKIFVTNHRFLAVASDGFARVLIVPHGTVEVQIYLTTEAKAYVNTYGGFTVATQGAEKASFNLDARSTNTATTKFYHGSTITGGSQRGEDLIPAGAKANAQLGGLSSGPLQSILTTGKNLLIELQNKNAQAQDMCVRITFREEL